MVELKAGARILAKLLAASVVVATSPGAFVPWLPWSVATVGAATGSTPQPSLALLSQSTWVGNQGAFTISFGLPSGEVVAGTRLSVAVYGKLATRSDFVQSLSRPEGSPIAKLGPVPLISLSVSGNTGTSQAPTSASQSGSQAGNTGTSQVPTSASHGSNQASGTQDNFSLAFMVISGGQSPSPTSPGPSGSPTGQPLLPPVDLDPCPSSGCSGVYPVVVTVEGLASHPSPVTLSTEMIYLSQTAGLVPLGIASLLPVSPSDTPGENQALASAIARAGHLAVTAVVNGAALIPRIGTASSIPSELATAAGNGAEILPSGFVPVDPSSLADSGLASELTGQVDATIHELPASLRTEAVAHDWVAGAPLDRNGLATLAADGFSRIVLPESDLVAQATSLTVTHPWLLDAAQHEDIEVATLDEGLAKDVASTADPVLAAHRVLADLAQVWSDAPNQTSPPRAVVFGFPPGSTVDPAFASAYLALLPGDPLLRPLTLDSYFATVPPPSGNGRNQAQLLPNPRVPLLPAAAIRRARQAAYSLASAAPAGGPRIDATEDLVFEAEGEGLGAAARSRLLNAFDSSVAALSRGVRLFGPDTITLTARKGSLPIEVASAGSALSHLVVEVSSDKLDFSPPPSRCHLLQRGEACAVNVTGATTTVEFRVVARASGDFPLKVKIVAPVGPLVFASASYTVRSASFSGVAYVITAAALGFLALWWGRSAYRTRQSSRLEADEDDNEAQSKEESLR